MDYNFERNRINQYIKFYNDTNKKLKKLGGSTKEIINLNQDLQKEDEETAKFFYPTTIYPQPIMSYQYITTDPNLKPNIKTIVNYESIINDIKKLTKRTHFELLESLSESIFDEIFKNKKVKKIKLKIEKLDIIKETKSVGIEVVKTKI